MMVIYAETGDASGVSRCGGHGTLEVGRSGHVFHQPTARADEMVMMLRELLGELVPGVVAVREDAPDDPGLFEHGEVAVRGALREPALLPEDLEDGERPLRTGEHLHEPGAAHGQTRPEGSKVLGDSVFRTAFATGWHRRKVYR